LTCLYIDEERAAYIYRDIINAQEPANDWFQ
jgi:hypothetical protein